MAETILTYSPAYNGGTDFTRFGTFLWKIQIIIVTMVFMATDSWLNQLVTE